MGWRDEDFRYIEDEFQMPGDEFKRLCQVARGTRKPTIEERLNGLPESAILLEMLESGSERRTNNESKND